MNWKHLFLPITIFMLACLPMQIAGQVGPPSLTAGIGQLAFKQGELDAELILQMVATKQSEIKEELAQRLILDHLECGNFATYNFVKNVLQTLFSDADPNVKKKEILKEATQLAMVIGIAEMYMREVFESLDGKKKKVEKIVNRDWKSYRNQREIKAYLNSCRDCKIDSMLEDEIQRIIVGSMEREYSDNLKSEWTDEIRSSINKLEKKFSAQRSPTEQSNFKGISAMLIDTILDCLFHTKSNLGNELMERDYLGLAFYAEYSKWPVLQSNQKNSIPEENKPENLLKQAQSSKALDTNTYLSTGSYLPNINTLKLSTGKQNFFREKRKKGKSLNDSPCKSITSNHILIDLVFDICLNSDEAHKAGFFNDALSVSDEAYKGYYSKYWYFKVNQSNSLFENFTGIKPELENRIRIFFKYFHSISTLIGENAISKSSLEKTIEIIQPRGTIENLLDGIRDNLYDGSVTNLDQDDFSAINELLKVFTKDSSASNNERSMYIIEQQLRPRLVALNFKAGGKMKPLLKDMDSLYEHYLKKNLSELKDSIVSIGEIRRFADYQQLFYILNHLDEASTYETLLRFLVNLGDIYSWDAPKVILNRLMSALDKYIVIDREENSIQVNVESLSLDLYDRFGDNQSRRMSLYLSVGANNAIAKFPNQFIAGNTVPTVQFVSEKIGLKFNLIDWNRRRVYDRGIKTGKEVHRAIYRDRKPMISDLHLLTYGSGLLYKVNFLNTETQMNSPIFGLGLGLTFFNGLDLNLSHAWLADKRISHCGFSLTGSHGFWCLSFDVKFVEYLAELSRKQKAKSK